MSTYDIDLVGMRAALEAADPNDTAKLSVANALKLLDIIEFVQGYQADLVCIDKVLDQVDAPHDPEEGVSLSSTRIRLLAGQLADATQRAEKATEDARDADQEREAWKEKTVEWRSKFDAARAPNPAAKADTRECVIHDGKCSEVGCGECDTAQPDAERPSDARDCKHVELCNTGCAWCGLGNEQIIAQLRERAEAETRRLALAEELLASEKLYSEAKQRRIAELEAQLAETQAAFHSASTDVRVLRAQLAKRDEGERRTWFAVESRPRGREGWANVSYGPQRTRHYAEVTASEWRAIGHETRIIEVTEYRRVLSGAGSEGSKP